mgnify:CR=1 FL=1
MDLVCALLSGAGAAVSVLLMLESLGAAAEAGRLERYRLAQRWSILAVGFMFLVGALPVAALYYLGRALMEAAR